MAATTLSSSALLSLRHLFFVERSSPRIWPAVVSVHGHHILGQRVASLKPWPLETLLKPRYRIERHLPRHERSGEISLRERLMHMRRGAGGLVFEGNVQGENGGVNVMATSSGVFSTVRAINELDWEYQRGKILFLCQSKGELYSLDEFRPPRGTDVLAITTFSHNHALPRGIRCDVVPQAGAAASVPPSLGGFGGVGIGLGLWHPRVLSLSLRFLTGGQPNVFGGE